MSSPLITDWLFDHNRRTPDAPAVATPDHSLSYRELAERVHAFAGALHARGVDRGTQVVIAVANSGAAVVASLGVQALGACAVIVGRDAGREALRDVLLQTGAQHAVIAARDVKLWSSLVEESSLAHAWVAGATAEQELGPVRAEPLRADGHLVGPAPALCLPRLSDADAPAQILFTSGSTGRPRGVIQTFRNIEANTRSIVEYLRLGALDRVLSILPLSYCYGRSLLQTHLYVGGSIFFDDRFMYPKVVMSALATERATGFAGVPLTFEIIKRQVDVASVWRPWLRYVTQAGGPMALETIDWVRSAFSPAELYVMYGQTEATARLSYLPPQYAATKRGSIGIAIPGVELAVLDERGAPAPVGVAGELCARGDNVTPGYLGAPEETAQLLRGGWMHTGDLAHRDGDGFFFIVGRVKELLKVGGHRVSPVEIENVLASHPAVLEAAVVGAPDPIEGERPVAFAVPRAAATPGEAELRQFCSAALPPYKVPREIHFVAALPRNEAGKLLRKQLTNQLATPQPGGLP